MEFRHMRNCYDVERMTHWLNFILALHKKATSPDFAGWYSEILAKKNYRSGILDLYKGEKVPHWEALIYPELEDEINQLTLDSAYELQYLASKPQKKFKPIEIPPIEQIEARVAAGMDHNEALARVRRDIHELRGIGRTEMWGRVPRDVTFDDNFLMPNEERR